MNEPSKGRYKIKRITNPKHKLFGQWVIYVEENGVHHLKAWSDSYEWIKQKRLEMEHTKPDDRVKRYLEGK